MILRVARLTLKDGVEGEFMQHARRRADELVTTVDGLVDILLARRLDGGKAVVLAMSR